MASSAEQMYEAVQEEMEASGRTFSRKINPVLLENAAKFSHKHGIPKQTLAYAVLWVNSGTKVHPNMFTRKKVEEAWEQFLELKVGDDMRDVVTKLKTPRSIDVINDVVMYAKIVHDETGSSSRLDPRFIKGCLDKCMDIPAVVRLVLTDMNYQALNAWGQEYLDWVKEVPSRKHILLDMGYDHEKVEQYVKDLQQ